MCGYICMDLPACGVCVGGYICMGLPAIVCVWGYICMGLPVVYGGVYWAFNTPITSSVFRYSVEKLEDFSFALKILLKHLFVWAKGVGGLAGIPLSVPISPALRSPCAPFSLLGWER